MTESFGPLCSSFAFAKALVPPKRAAAGSTVAAIAAWVAVRENSRRFMILLGESTLPPPRLGRNRKSAVRHLLFLAFRVSWRALQNSGSAVRPGPPPPRAFACFRFSHPRGSYEAICDWHFSSGFSFHAGLGRRRFRSERLHRQSQPVAPALQRQRPEGLEARRPRLHDGGERRPDPHPRRHGPALLDGRQNRQLHPAYCLAHARRKRQLRRLHPHSQSAYRALDAGKLRLRSSDG